MRLRMAMMLSFVPMMAAAQTSPAKPTVNAIVVQAKPLAEGLDFAGRVAAVDRVELRARLQGFLKEVKFVEGQDVKVGDVLFTIENDGYQAQVDQRQADLASAEASAANAALQLQRAAELLPQKTISQATYDDREAQKRVADANVLQAQAAVRQAQINLGYTTITAPVAGRIGRSNFQVGALVGPDSGPLALIVSQDPIYVLFPVTQRQILDVRKRLEKRAEADPQSIVRLTLADGSTYDRTGTIDFTDVTVDPGTDSVTVRAKFENPTRFLIDGQYVRVRVEEAKPEQAILVPQRAILNDQAGAYVFTIGPDSKVYAKRTTLGGARSGEVIVRNGLSVGDKVIVDGIQKVRPGLEVDAAILPQESKG